MKRLGKFPVWWESFINGVSQGPPVEAKPRVIYARGDEFYISDCGGHKRIEKRADGTFYARGGYTEIQSKPFSEILAELKEKAGPGGTVTVIGLPSDFGSKR
jgi:hypothetical protein